MQSTETKLAELTAHLRNRVAECRYLEARAALADYCRALRELAASLPPGDPGLDRLEDEWKRLREETRRRLLSGRAHAGARLARLGRLRPLYVEPPLPRRTWECTG